MSLLDTILGRSPTPAPARPVATVEPAPAPTPPHGVSAGRGAGLTHMIDQRAHHGSDDLEQWPPSYAELYLADQWLHLCIVPVDDTPELLADLRTAWIALEGTAGSYARANAVCGRRRLERDATQRAERAFGVQP